MKNWVRFLIVGIILVLVGGMYLYKNTYSANAELKKNSFIYTSTEEVNKELPTLLMLSTTTWPSCRQMESVLKEIAPKYKDKINIVKVDLNENPEYAYAFQVSVVPTTIYMKKDKQVFKGYTGAMDEASIKDAFKEMGVNLDE